MSQVDAAGHTVGHMRAAYTHCMTDLLDSRGVLYIRATMVENEQERDLVIADGVVADAAPRQGTKPDASGWVLPGLVDLHNHLSLASPVGDAEEAEVRVRASASLELAVGVLALREPGSPDDAAIDSCRADWRYTPGSDRTVGAWRRAPRVRQGTSSGG